MLTRFLKGLYQIVEIKQKERRQKMMRKIRKIIVKRLKIQRKDPLKMWRKVVSNQRRTRKL